VRLTADERREQVVEAALDEFAEAGLAGASTEAIARRAGISHAYLFRLYRTKRELFLAAVDRSYDHLLGTFRAAADGHDDEAEAFKAMGHSYLGLIEDPKRLLFQFHAYAASGGDPDIRSRVRARYLELFRFVRSATGASEDEVRVFMSAGLLISVSTAIGDPGLAEGGAYISRVLEH